MGNSKTLEALNEKILLFQDKRRGHISDEEDLILKTYIIAYQEVEDMIKTGNAHKFVNTPHHI